jgi:hypothetical protein
MKKRFVFLFFMLLSIQPLSCAKEEKESAEILAKINDYNLALKEFQSELAAELELERDLKLTQKTRREFLEGIIRKELLIQEAKKLHLDKQEGFVKTIERYWEATLIRDLMEMKGEEISKTILVSKEEVEEAYDRMKGAEERMPPLTEIEKEITRDLKEKKKTRLLKAWINELREKAKIEINEEVLYRK